MAELNIVPRDQVSFEDFARFGQRHDWKLDQKSVRMARNEESPEFLWRADGGATVKLVQSATLDRCYIVIVADEVEPLAEAIREEFPAFSLAEVIERLTKERSAAGRRAALRLVAATRTPRYDKAIYDAVLSGLEDRDPLVRIAALAAAFYLEWRQLRPLVERASESTDAGENVRIIAGDLLGLSRWNRG